MIEVLDHDPDDKSRVALQAAIDDIEEALGEWNENANLGRRHGLDHAALWAAMRAFILIHRRHQALRNIDQTRWFCSWVLERARAELRTMD